MRVGNILFDRDLQVVNLAASLAAGCQPCLKYHLRKAKDAGISEKEIDDILTEAEEIYIRAVRIMKSRAPSFENKNLFERASWNSTCENRMEVLVGVAVSFSVNNTDLSKRYLQYASQLGMSDPEIFRIRELSDFIHSKARAHVDLMMEESGVEDTDRDKDDIGCGCGC